MVDNKSNDRARAATIISELAKNLHEFSEVLLKLASENQTVPAKVEEPVDHKKKKEKDPNAPKRNLSSYMIYSQEIRPDMVKKHPDLKAIDIAKLIGEMWNGLSDKEKQPYIKKAENEKARFDKENQAYKATLGEVAPAAPAKRKAESLEKSEKSKKPTKSEKPAKSEKPEKSEKKKSKKTEIKQEPVESSPKKKAKKSKQ